jgi:hypothetical protein
MSLHQFKVTLLYYVFGSKQALGGYTGIFSFMARLIQLISAGKGMPLAQLPTLAYWRSLRNSSLLSDLVEALFGLLFMLAITCSTSARVIALKDQLAPLCEVIWAGGRRIWILDLQ